jgi:hypothetical protein
VEKSAFRKHWGEDRPLPYELVVADDSRRPQPGDVYIIHPSHAGFLDFMAETAVKSLMAERNAQGEDVAPLVDDRQRSGGRRSTKRRGKSASSSKEADPEPDYEVLTVDEASKRSAFLGTTFLRRWRSNGFLSASRFQPHRGAHARRVRRSGRGKPRAHEARQRSDGRSESGLRVQPVRQDRSTTSRPSPSRAHSHPQLVKPPAVR